MAALRVERRNQVHSYCVELSRFNGVPQMGPRFEPRLLESKLEGGTWGSPSPSRHFDARAAPPLGPLASTRLLERASASPLLSKVESPSLTPRVE